MVIWQIYQRQLEAASQEFGDIVSEAKILYTESKEPLKLRLNIVDGSIVDIFYSTGGKYSYHWERRIVNGSIYRHDNAPHRRWQGVKTFPKHFHNGSEEQVIESSISDAPEEALHQFLGFIGDKLREFRHGWDKTT